MTSLLPRIRPAIAGLKPYLPPQEGRRGLRLDFNENTVGCSPRVLEALRAVSAEDLARYPEYEDAESEIAARFGHTRDSMLLTNGVDDAIRLAVDVFAGSGDEVHEVVIVEPTFAIYRFYCAQSGALVRGLRLQDREVRAGVREYFLGEEELGGAVSSATRLAIAATPNSPTGNVIRSATLLEAARSHPECAFLVDEAYGDFAGPGYESRLASVLTQPNILVARTFSKLHGLAGARLGALFAHPELLTVLRRAHSPYNVNTLALICAQAALADREWQEWYRAEVLASRELVEERLSRLGISWWKSQANFVLFAAGERAAPLLSGLRAQGILIRDRRADVPGALRITCGTVEQTRFALDEIEKLWSARPEPRREKIASTEPGCVVFDMDGVLLDVRASYGAAIVETVRTLSGKAVTPSAVQAVRDEGGYNNDWDLCCELLRRLGIVVPYEKILQTFNGLYRGENWDGLIRHETWLLPLAALDRLRDRFHLAIFTGRPRAEAEYALRRFEVEAYFDLLVAREDVSAGKPAPEGLERVRAACAPGTLVAYVGDTIDDARCAATAGIHFIAVLGPNDSAGPSSRRALFQAEGCSSMVESVVEAAERLLDEAVARPGVIS